MKHVVQFPNIGFGEEGRYGCTTHAMMSMVHCSEHSFRRIEVRDSPFVFIPLFAHLAAIHIIEIRIIDMESVRGDTDDGA